MCFCIGWYRVLFVFMRKEGGEYLNIVKGEYLITVKGQYLNIVKGEYLVTVKGKHLNIEKVSELAPEP